MEANIVVTGAMALIAGGLGLWSLVVARGGKNKQPSDAERARQWEEAMRAKPVFEQVEPKWPAEMLQSLAQTNERIEAATEALVRPRPELEALVEEMRRPVPPPPPPDFSPITESLGQVQATLTKLVAQGEEPPPPPQQVEFPQIERQLASLTQQLQRLANSRGIPPSSEEPRTLPPATHSGTPINLTQFNTVPLLENVVYDCYPSEPDVYVLNIFNLGPAAVLMRSDADPFFGDIHSSIIAPQSGFNRLHVPESINLLADVGGATLSITLQTTA